MLKILVLGGGGREHALSRHFHSYGHLVYCHPGNGGTSTFCLKMPKEWEGIDPFDYGTVADFVEAEEIDLTVVGPEHLLSEGIADLFRQRRLTLFGSSRKAVQLERCKAWAKEFMRRYGIPTARYLVCHSSHEARKVLESHFHEWGGVVIKPTGLTEGKGVVVCRSLEEAEAAVTAIMDRKVHGPAGSAVVIEERLHGQELTLTALCDGKHFVTMPPVQDYKRLYDGDQGPNTAGIGACCSTDSTSALAWIQQQLFEKTVAGFQREHLSYSGFLYIGVMLTDEGPKVLEYNCRLGDPEAQVLLPLLETDLAAVMMKSCRDGLEGIVLKWKQAAACCLTMVSRGYPGSYASGYEIRGVGAAEKYSQIEIYHSGTARENGFLVTAGGRVLGVTAVGENLEEATACCYRAAEAITFHGAYYRRDIGRCKEYLSVNQ